MTVILEEDKIFQAVHEKYLHYSHDEQTRALALAREMFARDQANRIQVSEQEAFKKGIKEGIEKGIKKGIEKGREEGKHKNAIETAQKLKQKAIDLNTIAETTGLSLEEVQNV